MANALADIFESPRKLLVLTRRFLYFTDNENEWIVLLAKTLEIVFKLCAKLPLPVLHSLGTALGWVSYALSASYRQRLQANAALAGLNIAQRHQAIVHAGRLVAELPRLWLGAPVPVQWRGAQLIEQALASGQGLIFLTPHLGSFEITAQAYAARFGAQRPMTVLYRPARKPWARKLVDAARSRPGLQVASASLGGVKSLLQALRRGESLGILPDQVPPLGMGVWANFYGKPAYTMTLPLRLAQMTGASLLLAWGERLPRGQGFVVHVRPFPAVLSSAAQAAATQMNAAMESLINECPEQYLWGYERYKAPRAEGSS